MFNVIFRKIKLSLIFVITYTFLWSGTLSAQTLDSPNDKTSLVISEKIENIQLGPTIETDVANEFEGEIAADLSLKTQRKFISRQRQLESLTGRVVYAEPPLDVSV